MLPIYVCVHAQLCPTLCDPHGLEPTRLLCPWDFLGENTGVGCYFLLWGNLPNPGIEPVSPLAGGFFTTEPSGKPCYLAIVVQLLSCV